MAGDDTSDISKLLSEIEELKTKVEKLEESKSKQAETERALQKSEEMARAMLNATTDLVYLTDSEWRILALSKKAAERFGKKAEDIIGTNVFDYFPSDISQRRMSRGLEVMRTGKPLNFQDSRDGMHFDISLFPALDSAGNVDRFAVYVRDITETKKIEEQLSATEGLYRAVVEASPDGIVVADLSGKIIAANRQAAKLIGYEDPAQLIGLSVISLLAPQEIDRASKRLAKVLDVEFGKDVEYKMKRRDGAFFESEVTARMLESSTGEPTAFVLVFNDISQRKKTEQALRESEERLRLMTENSVDFLFITDNQGLMVYGSESGKNFFGYDPKDRVGRLFTDNIHPSDIPKAKEQFKKVLGGETVKSFDLTAKHKDGRLIPIEAAAVPIYEGGKVANVFGIVRDISERKLLEAKIREYTDELEEKVVERTRELQETNTALRNEITERKEVERELEKLAAVVRHSSELINLATPEGKMLFLNEAGEKFLGIEPHEVEKVNIRDVIPEKFSGTLETEVLPALMSGGKWEGDLQYRNLKTGQLKECHAITFTINDPDTGDVLYLANVSRDITDRKRAENERRAIEARLQQAEKLESLGILAGGIAHDFNNLLMGILGNADLALLRLSEASPIRPYVEDIMEASQKAADLVRQMLAYSGKGRFVIKTVSLSEICSEMAHLLQTTISKDTSITLNLYQDLPVVEVDITQIQQIIMNMVINANEAIGTKKMGVIGISTGVEECSAECLDKGFLRDSLLEGEYVYLEISDNGCGMDKETIGRIFDPFFTTKFTGRGLGLSAVLGIVRGHRGELMVESKPGEGTKFKVLFPKFGGERSSVKKMNKDKDSGKWRGRGTILLVDDEKWILKTVEVMLKDVGFEVLTAVNGRECLEMVESKKDEIRCILLDLTMPEKSGEEVLAELKKKEIRTPVILSSGYDEQSIMEKFDGGQVAGFIQKPYRSADLKRVLKGLIGA